MNCDSCNNNKHHRSHHTHNSINKMTVSATFHCLIGCAIGELAGVTIGTHIGFEPHSTVILAGVLSFVSGYIVSTIPLLRAKLLFIDALKLVFAADTLSILTMTLTDNLIMLIIPGAMDKDLAHPIYWVSRIACFVAAFVVAFPVNRYLLLHSKGHALTHEYHHH